MAPSRSIFCLYGFLIIMALATTAFSSALSPYYYDRVCPEALPAIKRVVEAAVSKERRMGASLLRLHFHDCFVNGCDASLLLDATPTIDSEKNSRANRNSTRGFEVIDQIKWEVDQVCGGPVVSCADILAVAARDSVVALGGPTWEVQLGRRDSTAASRTQADADLPNPFMDLAALTENFGRQGLDLKDLVVLSGGHTIGLAQCFTFRGRIYNTTSNNINSEFAQERRKTCPLNGGNSILSPLDPTPGKFDSAYYSDLVQQKGLLISDQALFGSGSNIADELINTYGSNTEAFWTDFATSMINMGNIKPLTGNQGEIRCNCRTVN